MRRMMILFIALTIAFLIPFLIWGHAWEWSTDQALQQLRRYGALAAPMAFLLLVGDLFLPIPATAVMAGLGWLYGPWLGGLVGAAGSFCSGFLAYALCRRYGQKAVDALLSKDEQTRDISFSMITVDGFLRFPGGCPSYRKWSPAWPASFTCRLGLWPLPF